jgi:ATP synthase protein I
LTDSSKDPRSSDDFVARLRAARAREDEEAGRKGPLRGDAGSGMGLGFRIAVELVAGIGVGALIGYALDGWLGTRPWLMVLFFFLGAAAGVVNAYRVAKGLDDSVGLGAAMRRRDRDRKND